MLRYAGILLFCLSASVLASPLAGPFAMVDVFYRDTSLGMSLETMQRRGTPKAYQRFSGTLLNAKTNTVRDFELLVDGRAVRLRSMSSGSVTIGGNEFAHSLRKTTNGHWLMQKSFLTSKNAVISVSGDDGTMRHLAYLAGAAPTLCGSYFTEAIAECPKGATAKIGFSREAGFLCSSKCRVEEEK